MDNKKKVIIVDDISFMLFRLQETLKVRYEVFPAQNEEILFDVLMRVMPDLILLDINIPGTSGFDIIKKLKENDSYKNVPVIFLSGNKDKESIVMGLSLGAEDFITKPVADAELIESIDKVLYPENYQLPTPVILAIDDSPAILESINKMFGQKYSIYTLPFPERIHEIMKLMTPDLFIVDYNMPKMSGFDIINIVRGDPNHEDTPIFFLTSENSIDHISVSVHLGVCEYIIKPINEEIITAKIEKHLENYMLRRRLREFNNIKEQMK